MNEESKNEPFEGYKLILSKAEFPGEFEMILAYRRKILAENAKKLTETHEQINSNQGQPNREYLALILECDRVKRIMDQKNCHALAAFFALEHDEQTNTDSNTIVLMGLSKDGDNFKLIRTDDNMFGEVEETWAKKILISDDKKSEDEFREFFQITK